MTAVQPIFYYDTNSPYAYLAAHRIGARIPGAVWRPIAFAFLLRAHGRTPWSLGPGRGDGMRDVERRAEEAGLPPVRWPDGWPVETYSLLALRAMIVAEDAGRLKEMTLALYRVSFAEGRGLQLEESVLGAATRAGLDPDAVRSGIEDEEIKARLKAYTDEALERGVQGVPTIAVGDELFWGDDRLDDAAATARGG